MSAYQPKTTLLFDAVRALSAKRLGVQPVVAARSTPQPPPAMRRSAQIKRDDPRAFTIQTGRVRATKTTDKGADRYFVEGVASSSVRDRHGDTLTDAAQTSMLAQCKDLTMWLSHRYDVPEDILGTCSESWLENSTDPHLGACVDLNIRCEIYANNPRALESWKAVDAGVRLAFSIGGYFTDVELDEDAEALENFWFPCVVKDLELLEISLVGIPANPRAYTKGLDSGFLPGMLESIHDRARAADASPRARKTFARTLLGDRKRVIAP